MAEDIKEYGAITLDIEDNIQDNANQKMRKIKLTTDPTDKLYLNEQPPPTYYLPFYIDIFQSNKKTIKDITSANVKLTDLFTKRFTEFITITLKQPLTAKTCVNFIKDKSLVQQFITEYKSKNPSIEGDKYNSYNISKYKTFIKNVYIFFIKILATEAGSFLYKYKEAGDSSNKKLYYVKLLPSNTVPLNTNISDSINNFIEQKKESSTPEETREETSEETSEEVKKRRADKKLKKEKLYIDEHIYLFIMKNKEFEYLTKTILDNYFKSKEENILKEKKYDFKNELDYNKLLKNIILDKLIKTNLYTENKYDPDKFNKKISDEDIKPILDQLIDSVNERVDELNQMQKDSAIIKNNTDIKGDIITTIKLFYIEKEKNIQKREKKIHINITLIKGNPPNLENSNLTLVDLKKITYEGAPTFSDIEKFQKKLQEDISNYIKNCQNPKDIQSKVEKECNEICSSTTKTIKNKLWCSICTNYIKCVYNNPEYNPTEERSIDDISIDDRSIGGAANQNKKKGNRLTSLQKKTISKKRLQLLKPNRNVSIKLH